MPNQKPAFAWPFGNGTVRIGTWGSSASASNLSSRVFSRLDCLPMGLRGWVQSNKRADFKLTYKENYGKLWKTFLGGEGWGLVGTLQSLSTAATSVNIRYKLGKEKVTMEKKKTCSTTRLSQKLCGRDFYSHVFANPVRCTIHVNNNRQLNTLSTVHREVKRNRKKKNVYILCAQAMVLLIEESFNE